MPVVRRLRELGHDVLTSLDAGQANRRVPDSEVLAFAASEKRILLTQNRRDFLRIHHAGAIVHHGLVLCTADADFLGQAQRIHEAVSALDEDQESVVIRVNCPVT
jgi:predicted nuclease of predicted toxin-antitoxin system